MSAATIGIAPAFDPRPVGGPPTPVRVPRGYLDALQVAGARVVILPPVPDEAAAEHHLELVQGVMLIGGHTPLPDPIVNVEVLPPLYDLNPERYVSDAAYARVARRRGMPLFGVCRGLQVMNEALGGVMDYRRLGTAGTTNHYQVAPDDVATHEIAIEIPSRFHTAIGRNRLRVNSFHRTAVLKPAPGLRIAARSEDGVVEVVESDADGFVMGVQFHPETMPRDDPSRRAYSAFVAAASEWCR
ncbi:MAG: type 1 glutamine amidotransferase [Firmicutes bacterium]|nr:type 1 glutamine amidotransferase [Bacillota bacterium]